MSSKNSKVRHFVFFSTKIYDCSSHDSQNYTDYKSFLFFDFRSTDPEIFERKLERRKFLRPPFCKQIQ